MGNVYYPRAKVILDFALDPFDSGGEPISRTLEATPRSVEWERNSLREADAAKVELDYRDFPFDPRTIQWCKVGIYAGDVLDPNGNVSKSRRRRRFLGFVDVAKTKLDEGGETVELPCRDYTSLFLDVPWNVSTPLRIDRSLFLLMKDVLARVPGADGIPVAFSDDSLNSIVLANRLGRSKWVPKEKKADAWSALVELLGRVGLLPVFRLDTLTVVRAGEFGASTSKSFVYGQNVKSLRFERKVRESRTKQIEIRSWDDRKRISRTATFPEAPIVVRSVKGADGKVKNDFANLLTFNVSGSYSVAELRELAERVYNDAARNQIEGELETMEMKDLDSQTLLTLANGDSVSLLLGKDERANIAGLSLSEAVELLTTGPDAMKRDVARALALAFRRADTLATRFFVTTARHKWTREDGYSLRVTFQNFAGVGR